MSVRIGFIGVGSIAASHLADLVRIPEAEVVALSDVSPECIEFARRKVNEASVRERGSAGPASEHRPLEAAAYTDYRLMLRNERLDAVYLCLPPFAHGDPEEAVVEAGLPMLVEKPVSLDLRTSAHILKLVRAKNLTVATGYQTRYAGYVERARHLIADRTIGMALATRFGRTPDTSWYHRQDQSGGQMIEMATHQVDLLRYLVGEVESVYAAAGTRINNKAQPDYDIFDVNCTTMRFDSGAVANLAVNFVAQLGDPMSGAAVHIFCDGLTVSLGGAGLRATSAEGVEEVASEESPMALEDQAFVRAVAEDRRDLIKSDYESGVRTLAVTIANDRSARTGQSVSVSDLLAEEAAILSA
ncbi:Gfo/Idh/MocA family protein [Actinopolymorpha pittospori]|uniref:Dehydrogenase n=1 Tax=Actinopolymorpha pittospori TaxID=648752 RepID=A0A927MZ11_9ACTN|nr:Gfo/Idh/MocA family oxidoreductase [Actinopolymorpha pittospori]MBE1609161.1 putative dehydrogenase [Actinopolymorpha pittospori]